MQPVEQQRESTRRGLRGVAGSAGHHHDGSGREQRAARGDQLRDRPPRPPRAIHPQRDSGGQAEQRKAHLEVDDRAPERSDSKQRHERRQVEHRPERIVGRREVEVDRNRNQPDDRGDRERDRQRAQRRALDFPDERSRGQQPHHKKPDRRHHRHEHHPPGHQQLRRDRGGRDVRNPKLRGRPGAGPDRVRECPLDRMAVNGDRSPEDQVPTLGEMGPQRNYQRVRIGRRPVHRPRRLLMPVGIGHGDDREPRLDRLVVRQLDVRRRSLKDDACRRNRLNQVRVRGRAARQPEPHRECGDGDQQRAPDATVHARSRPLDPPINANPPASRPSTPTISATIVSSETPPPPSESATSIVGAGAGRGLRPGPIHDRTVRVDLLDLERVGLGRGRLRQELKQRVLTGWRAATGPGHLRDHGAVA